MPGSIVLLVKQATPRELIISNCTSLTNITTDSFAFSDYNNLNMTGMRDIERMNN